MICFKGKVEIVWKKEKDERIASQKFIADSSGNFLYIQHLNGISKLNTHSWERTLAAGSIEKSNENIEDGKLLEARFTRKLVGQLRRV